MRNVEGFNSGWFFEFNDMYEKGTSRQAEMLSYAKVLSIRDYVSLSIRSNGIPRRYPYLITVIR